MKMKYVFSHGVNKDGVDVICCVSHFAGKPVRGFAKCNPIDQFDLEKGMKLAQLRCDAKVAEKRVKRATNKRLQADLNIAEAVALSERMHNYYNDATAELENIMTAIKMFEATL